MTEAFFELRDGLYVPGDFCRGPWNRNSLHGRAIAALLAYGVESHVDDASWHVARLTVDMFRLAPHQPVELRTDLVRDGNRVRAVDATLVIEGVEVARASSVLLRRSEQPPTERARVPAPLPEDVPGDQLERADSSGDFRDAWETKTLRDESGDTAFVWIRMAAPLIGGVELTPLVRTAGASDYASPASNRSRPRLPFINADVTLHLSRYPAGDWLGVEVVEHQNAEGVAVGACRLHDLEGPVGMSTVSAVANDRERARAATPSVGA